MKLLKRIKDKILPVRMHAVTISIWNEHAQRYIGKMTVTTEARTKREAKANIKAWLQLHVTDAWVVKQAMYPNKES